MMDMDKEAKKKVLMQIKELAKELMSESMQKPSDDESLVSIEATTVEAMPVDMDEELADLEQKEAELSPKSETEYDPMEAEEEMVMVEEEMPLDVPADEEEDEELRILLDSIRTNRPQ